MFDDFRNWLAQLIDRLRGRVESAERRVNPDTPSDPPVGEGRGD